MVKKIKNKISKSVAVWLISISDKKVLLQKRTESNMIKIQSNSDVCQPTWNGKCDNKEKIIDAIKREAEEELGKEFANSFNFSTLTLFSVGYYSFRGKDFFSYNYWGTVIKEQLVLIKLYSSSQPSFITVGISDMTNVKSKNDKDANPKKQVVLFKDQYLVLKKLIGLKEVLIMIS